MTREIAEKYGNRLRLRVCGLCWHNDTLLMINHKNLAAGSFWAPPGGGVELGESAPDALVREFQEETTLTVTPEKFLFTCELLKPPLHAVELFFEVKSLGGMQLLGHDPELSAVNQMIQELRYMTLKEILALPANERHGIFNHATTVSQLRSLTGFYRI